METAITTRPGLPALRWLPVWRRNVRVWTKLAVPSVLSNFGEPLLYLLALGYGLGSFVGRVEGLPYVTYLASGIVCSSAMVTASFEGMYSAYTRMEVQKTWQAMLAAPLDVRDIVLGETIWAASKSLLGASAILVVAAALGAVASWQALWALPVVLLTGLTFAAMAMVVTALAPGYDFFLYYNTLFLTPMLLLSGVFFPLDRMPEIIQTLSTLLPLTHAVAVVRPLVIGQPPPASLAHLAVLLAFGSVALGVAVHLIRRRLTH